MTSNAMPSEDNDYLAEHVAVIRNSLRHWTGRELVPPRMSDTEAALHVFEAPFALVSQDAARDPMFNYSNRTGLQLFAMSWAELTALPSRLSMETVRGETRAALVAEVAAHGFVDHHAGTWIGRHGRRFRVEDALIWTLLEANGLPCGQASLIEHWQFV